MDIEESKCGLTLLLCLACHKIRGAGARNIFLFAYGGSWEMETWLFVLARHREFLTGTVWLEQCEYVAGLLDDRRDDDFASHLMELRKWRHLTFLEDERRQIGSGMPCKHCLPEWYGWACRHCGGVHGQA